MKSGIRVAWPAAGQWFAVPLFVVLLAVSALPPGAPGTLDPGFDGDGVRTRRIQPLGQEENEIETLPDGRILVLAHSTDPNGGDSSNKDWRFLRFNADGSNDASFGVDGTVLVDALGGFDTDFAAEDALVLADGRFIAGGRVGSSHIAVARFLPDGSLDPSFGGGDGVFTIARISILPSGGARLRSLAMQADGRILVAGHTAQGATDKGHFILRLDADGALDTSFGAGGVVTDDRSLFDDATRPLVRVQGTRILVGGSLGLREGLRFFGYSPAGTRDAAFGTDGFVRGPTVGNEFPNPGRTDFDVQADDRIVYLAAISNSTSLIGRLLADGAVDPSFGGDGIVNGPRETTSALRQAFATRLAIQPDGRIVIAGSTGFRQPARVFRLFADGVPDLTLGDDQVIAFTSTRGNTRLALDAQGRIVLADHEVNDELNGNGVQDELVVARLLGGAGVAPDVRADPFTLTDQFDVPAGSLRTSDTMTVSGLAEGGFALIRVDGGLYSINNGPFTDEMGKVQNGDTVRVQHTAAATPGTRTTTTLRIGAGDDEVNEVFSSRTVGGGTPGTLQFSAAGFAVDEGGNVTATVTRTGGTVGAVSVNCTPSTENGQTAAAGADYTATAQTLDWADGDDSVRTCAVATANDSIDEPDETFTLTLSAPSGDATLGAPASATATILDNDLAPAPGVIAFTSATFSVAENGLLATISAVRSGGVEGVVSVDFATSDGSAIAPQDYSASSGTLVWNDQVGGEQSFTVTIVDDGEVEPGETVNLQLSNPGGGAILGTGNNAVLEITNDDLPTVQFGSAGFGVAENAGPAPITITRSSGVGASSVVFATANGTAVATGTEADYTATTLTVGFADGETRKTVNLPIANDARFEPDETVNLTLANATGATLGSPATATLTITNDDPSPGRIRWVTSRYQVLRTRNFAADFSACAVREDGSAGAVRVDVPNPPSFTGVTISPNRLQWADGDTTPKCLSVLISSTSRERNVGFFMQSSGGSQLGTPSAANLEVIFDDEPGSGGSAIILDRRVSVAENAGAIRIPIQRTSTAVANTVRVRTLDDSARAGQDYTAVDQTLSWAAGDTTAREILVPILNDRTAEGGESFRVLLQDPTPGDRTALRTGMAFVSITDNDAPGTVRFTTSSVDVVEGGTALITLERTGGDIGTISVEFSTGSGGTATAGADFVARSETVTFADGETSRSVPVTILDDTAVEGNESLQLGLSGPAASPPSNAVLTIVDDDSAFRIDQDINAEISLVEDQPVSTGTLTVSRTGLTAGSASVDVCIFLGTSANSASGADVSLTPVTISFAPGETGPKPVPITLVADRLPEDDEGLLAYLCSPVNGGIATGEQRVVVIRDDDAQYCLRRFTVGSQALFVEGQVSSIEGVGNRFAVFKIGGRSFAGSATVSVRPITGPGTATPGEDFVASETAIEFPAGRVGLSPTLVNPGIVQDDRNEPDEPFTVQLTGVSGGTPAPMGPSCPFQAGDAPVTFTILNDDAVVELNRNSPTLTIVEGSSTTIPLAVNGPIPPGASVRVTITAQSATEGADFTAFSGSLDDLAGGIPVSVLADNAFDDGETFSVNLTASSNVRLGSLRQRSVTVTMRDSSSLLFCPSLSNPVFEGSTATVFMSRIGNLQDTVTVQAATVDGTALAGVDYASSSQTLTFLPGERGKTFTIATTSDPPGNQGDRFFDLVLSEPNPVGTRLLGSDSDETGACRITIVDPDERDVYTFDRNAYTVRDDAGSVVVTVRRSGPLLPASVALQTITGGVLNAQRGVDFDDPGTLAANFVNGQSQTTVSIPIIDNPERQPNRSFAVGLDASVLSTGQLANVTITDSQTPPTTDSTIEDGTSNTITVQGGTGELIEDGTSNTIPLQDGTGARHSGVAKNVRLNGGLIRAKLSSGNELVRGLYFLRITDVVPGTPVVVTYDFPAGTAPQGYAYCVQDICSEFADVAAIAGDSLTLVLEDGGSGDADGLPDGVIVHAGGPTRQAGPAPSPSPAPSSGGGAVPALALAWLAWLGVVRTLCRAFRSGRNGSRP